MDELVLIDSDAVMGRAMASFMRLAAPGAPVVGRLYLSEPSAPSPSDAQRSLFGDVGSMLLRSSTRVVAVTV